MTANIHPKTGIRFGTIYGNKVPELLDYIQQNGENVSHNKRREEMKKSLKGVIESAFTDFDTDGKYATLDVSHKGEVCEYMVDTVKDLLNGYGGKEVFDTEEAEAVFDSYIASEELDIDSIFIKLENGGLWDNMEGDGDEYEYIEDHKDGKIHYEANTLGGAYLIWVLSSPYTTEAAPCSPCCPNAGNLSKAGWYDTYCPPPEDLPKDWNCPPPKLLSEEIRAKHAS